MNDLEKIRQYLEHMSSKLIIGGLCPCVREEMKKLHMATRDQNRWEKFIKSDCDWNKFYKTLK